MAASEAASYPSSQCSELSAEQYAPHLFVGRGTDSAGCRAPVSISPLPLVSLRARVRVTMTVRVRVRMRVRVTVTVRVRMRMRLRVSVVVSLDPLSRGPRALS